MKYVAIKYMFLFNTGKITDRLVKMNALMFHYRKIILYKNARVHSTVSLLTFMTFVL